MHIISLLKKEHEEIERELIELENLIQELEETGEYNISNIYHTCKKLVRIWDLHEKEEENIFPLLKNKQGIIIPIQTMFFQHRKLKKYKENIFNAITTGNKIKTALMKNLIDELRKHIKFEDEILYTAVLEKIPDLDTEKLKEKFPKIGSWLKN
jgi:DUF438 domain-containing protein